MNFLQTELGWLNVNFIILMTKLDDGRHEVRFASGNEVVLTHCSTEAFAKFRSEISLSR